MLWFTYLFLSLVAKTFASGKTEKVVYDCLASLDLPTGKVGQIKKGSKNKKNVFCRKFQTHKQIIYK